jgi:hypothetical protein
MLNYTFYDMWNILLTFGIFYDHLVCTCCVPLVHFSHFGIMYRDKSGNPAHNPISGLGLILRVHIDLEEVTIGTVELAI